MNTSTNNLRAQRVEIRDHDIVVYLSDGRSVSAPLEWFPRLRKADQKALNDYRLIGKGQGIRWDALDEDISVAGLLAPSAGATPPRQAPPCSRQGIE